MPAFTATSSNQICSGFGRTEATLATPSTEVLLCLEQAVRRDTAIQAHPAVVMNRENIIAVRAFCRARKCELRAALILALADPAFEPGQWLRVRDRIDG